MPTSFTANGALYVIGGVDASNAPQATTFCGPCRTRLIGDVPAWQELKAADLPEAARERGGRAGGFGRRS